DLVDWDCLSAEDQKAIAATVSRSRLERFRFIDLYDHELGAVRHRLGHFVLDDAEFVLIPGGRANLGFSPQAWNPTPEERESWKETSAELGISADVRSYLKFV